MEKKETKNWYVQPETEIIEVRIENHLLIESQECAGDCDFEEEECESD